jgi:PAS domain S-box-containing protein
MWFRWRKVLLISLLIVVNCTLYAEIVTVAVFDGVKPVCYVNDQGQVAGLFPEVLRSILEEEGYTVQFVTGLTFHDAYEKVLSGEIDILPAFLMTEERKELFRFNKEPFIVSWSQLFVPPDSTIESVLDLHDKKIALMEGGQNGKNFIQMMKDFNIPFVPVYYPDNQIMTQKLLGGDVDGLVSYNSLAWYESRIKSSNILFSPSQSYIALRKGGPEFLLEIIDTALVEMRKDENSVYNRELNSLRFVDTVEVIPPWIFYLTAAAVLVFICVMLFVFLLRLKVAQVSVRLQDSEENYKRLFNGAKDLISVVGLTDDENGMFLDVNESFCEKTGYSQEEMYLMNADEFLKNETTPWREEMSQELRRKGFHITETTLPIKDGGSFPVETSSQLFESRGRQFLLSISRDLSFRDEFDSALSAIQQKYSTIADYNYNWEFWMDDQGQFIYVSPSCERISGYAASEFLENSELLLQIIYPEDRELWDSHFSHQNIEDHKETDTQIRILHKDGSLRWLQHDCWHIRSKDGIDLGLRGNFRDISERKEMEEQLSRKQRLESLGILAGGIAHDFNNVLTVIKGYSDFGMTRFSENQEISSLFETIHKASNRGEALIGKILDFSSNKKTKMIPVQISSMVKEVLTLVTPSFPSSIKIKQIIDNHSYIMADEGQVHRVIMNICTNARLAMPDGGCLTVRLKELEKEEILRKISSCDGTRWMELSFHDTGVGMTEEVKSRIFDPFYTTRKSGEGTGMGLSVVHGLISEWNGQITVESLPGKGTSIILYLPILDYNIDPLEEQKQIYKIPGKLHIIAIDDESLILDLLTLYLEKEGFVVHSFSSALEGIKNFHENPEAYGLAILDMTMPEKRGDLVARELKELRPDLPIILFSGFNENLNQNELPPGIDAFMQKPFDRKTLLEVIAGLV